MARASIRRVEQSAAGPAVAPRIDALAWDAMAASLDKSGYATTGPLLDADACAALIDAYSDAKRFRSRIVMQRHAFGRGEYQYFDYPLPPVVTDLRQALYPHLAPLANRWNEHLRLDTRFPPSLQVYLKQCHAAGQTRPTPLMLKYGADDFNCLHQDLYGPFVFPLQATILLSDPERDFSGGEFLLVEQRPRAQSRAEVVPLRQGEAVIFAVNHRPVQGSRGFYRGALRHGVSRVRSGGRYTLGIIFHDAA
ncbi:MAG: 2OG-Fe(II) oxygenase [Dongiaceae bacterium]